MFSHLSDIIEKKRGEAMTVHPAAQKINLHYVVFVLLFAVAGLCQFLEPRVDYALSVFVFLLANTIFLLLILLWIYSIKMRIVKKSTRRLLITIGFFLFFWLVIRFVKYKMFRVDETITRYLWYSYYFPQCIVPPLALIVGLDLNRKERVKISWKYFLLLIPALILILLVMTNDLHQWAFVFDQGIESFHLSYKHNVVYYLVCAWMIGCIAAFLFVLVFQCKNSHSFSKFWIPFVAFVLCTILVFLGFYFDIDAYKGPELMSFSFLLIFECMTYIHLIPSNNGYADFFAISATSTFMTDERFNIIYKSQHMPNLDKETLRKAKQFPYLYDQDHRLNCRKISGGYIFYIEDIHEINQINSELLEANERLQEEVDLSKAENELTKKRIQLEEQHRLYDSMTDFTRDDLEKINALLSRMEEMEEEDHFTKVALIGSFVKRKCNLLMIIEKGEKNLNEELILSIRENLDYLKLSNTETSFLTAGETEISSSQLLFLYSIIEVCILKLDENSKSLFMKLNLEEDITLSLSSERLNLSYEDFSLALIEKMGFALTLSSNEDEECFLLTNRRKER